MNFEMKKRKQSWYNKEQILKELEENRRTDDVLDHLLGNYDRNGSHSDYVVYKYEYNPQKWYHRLNRLWFVPLFILTVPFQWLVKGDTGVHRDSRIGKIIDKLVKLD